MDIQESSNTGSQSIDRALMLLSLISSHGGEEVPMPVLTKQTGLSRPTVRRILLALMVIGVCAKLALDLLLMPGELYSLGAAGGH